MRAVIVTGPDSTPSSGTFDEPQPTEGESIVELVGAGLHQIVRSRAAGTHYSSESAHPNIPGVDAVARSEDGTLVYTGWVPSPYGTMAERMAARFGLPLPAGADPLAVAAGVNPAMSGWMPLSARVDEIGELGTVWILGATGMSGRIATQEAKLLGAKRIVAVGRNAEVLGQLADAGAETVSLTDSDPASKLAATRADGEPSLVLDYLWGPVAGIAFDAISRGGAGFDDDTATDTSYVQIGGLAGLDASVPAAMLRSQRIRISGSGIGSVSRTDILQRVPKLIEYLALGELAAPYTTYPIDKVADAWSHTGPTRAVIVP